MNWTTNTHRVLLFAQPLNGKFFSFFIFNLKKIKEFLMWWSFIFFSKMKTQIQFNQKEKYSSPFWKGIRKMIKIILLFILTIFYVISFKLQDISAMTACSWVYILSSSAWAANGKGRLLGLVTLVLYSGWDEMRRRHCWWDVDENSFVLIVCLIRCNKEN